MQRTDWQLPEMGWRLGKMGERSQKVESSSYKTNCRYNVQHDGCGQQHCTAQLKVARRADLESSHQKKKNSVTMYGDRC